MNDQFLVMQTVAARVPVPRERRYLKDRIVEGVSKAVKQIQEYHIANTGHPGEVVVLKNSDWQLCKLCEHLDHALLHGLRHITNGYWPIVKEFTHKDVVKDLRCLSHVTTKLGQGRAWLYLALNDGLLESYLRCFDDSIKMVKKYYVKEALVLDQERLALLKTLISGLDFVSFELEYDASYFDFNSHMPNVDCHDNEDKVSLCSMESMASQLSVNGPDPRHSINSVISEESRPRSASGYMHPNDLVGDGNRMARIDEISAGTYEERDEDELEVIHVQVKKSKKKTRKRHNANRGSEVPSPGLEECAPISRDESNQSKKDSGIAINKDLQLNITGDDKNDSDREGQIQPSKQAEEKVISIQSKSDILTNNILNIKPTDTMSSNNENHTVTSSVEPEINPKDSILKTSRSDPEKRTNESKGASKYSSGTKSSKFGSGDSELFVQMPNNLKQTLKDFPDISSKEVDKSEQILSVTDGLKTNESNNDVIDNDIEQTSQTDEDADRHEFTASIYELKPETPDDEPEIIEIEDRDKKGEAKATKAVEKKERQLDFSVDNNTKLQLMLEVFQSEDEHFYKMYKSWTGHTEGCATVTFILLTDQNLYLLGQAAAGYNFTKDAVISFPEIDFVSLSMDFQVVHIVCTNRRKQFWVTTGDEAKTRAVVKSLEECVRKSNIDLLQLSVLTDATTQKITMKKWLSQELAVKNYKEIEVSLYCLVYWEDPESGASKGITKEGELFYKVDTTYRNIVTQTWKLGYFVLKDGVLYQYTDQHDNRVPVKSVIIRGDDCCGCRRCPHADRPHSFEIILSDGSDMKLSAHTEGEAYDWLQCLCQAVSEGMGASNSNQGCISCSMVLTPNKLFMCHEDLQTSFFRTLGSASLPDITGITIDPAVDQYCILDFESSDVNVSSEQWVLYFLAPEEQVRFRSAISLAWQQHFQVSLPETLIEDIVLQRKCREMAATL